MEFDAEVKNKKHVKKLYYSIGEVSQMLGEEPYVLRYWETEFEQLRPQKNRAGNRIYTDRDIALLKAIRYLLREKRYTIEGAKEQLKYYNPTTGKLELPDQQTELRTEDLQSLRELLTRLLRWLRSLE